MSSHHTMSRMSPMDMVDMWSDRVNRYTYPAHMRYMYPNRSMVEHNPMSIVCTRSHRWYSHRNLMHMVSMHVDHVMIGTYRSHMVYMKSDRSRLDTYRVGTHSMFEVKSHLRIDQRHNHHIDFDHRPIVIYRAHIRYIRPHHADQHMSPVDTLDI
jgi:hypothetical protein